MTILHTDVKYDKTMKQWHFISKRWKVNNWGLIILAEAYNHEWINNSFFMAMALDSGDL